MSPQPRSRFGQARWPANVTTRAWILFDVATKSRRSRIRCQQQFHRKAIRETRRRSETHPLAIRFDELIQSGW